MAHSRNQNAVDRDVSTATNQHVVLSNGRTDETGIVEGSADMAKKVKIELHHNPLTDVMFADIRPVGEGEHVDVIEVGDKLGFPGQIQVRVDWDKEIVYGITIQNYTAFRRKLLWRYHMWSMRRAIQLLISTLLVGLRIDKDSHRRPVLAG